MEKMLEKEFTVAEIYEVIKDYTEEERVLVAMNMLAGINNRQTAKLCQKNEKEITRIYNNARKKIWYKLTRSKQRSQTYGKKK